MLRVLTEKIDNPKGILSNTSNLKDGIKDDKFSLLLKSFSLNKGNEKTLNQTLNIDDLQDLNLNVKTDKKENSKSSLATLFNMVKKDSSDIDEKDGSISDKSPLTALFNLDSEASTDEELINTDIIKTLPEKDLKQNIQNLIGEAKEYLKDQISKKVEIKELPKTLGGLIKLAEKSGIDVSSINVESIGKTEPKNELLQPSTLPKQLDISSIPHSTSELVMPKAKSKTEKEISKPLNALLNSKAQTTETTTIENVLSSKEPVKKETSATDPLNALLTAKDKEETQSTESESDLKIEGEKHTDKSQLVSQTKNEQLSNKIAEAKQLVHNTAQNIKESIENYKSPFTRIKMQLNPQKFGEMNVTMIQRGNNLHININANTSALNVMMQNAHELRTALSAHGLGDASMNFSSQQQQQQHEQSKQQNAHFTYEEYQEFDEEFTEMATSLEVVVPRYI